MGLEGKFVGETLTLVQDWGDVELVDEVRAFIDKRRRLQRWRSPWRWPTDCGSIVHAASSSALPAGNPASDAVVDADHVRAVWERWLPSGDDLSRGSWIIAARVALWAPDAERSETCASHEGGVRLEQMSDPAQNRRPEQHHRLYAFPEGTFTPEELAEMDDALDVDGGAFIAWLVGEGPGLCPPETSD